MEMMLDVQGFRQSNNEFILKELGAITVQKDETGKQGLARILFKPPCPWQTLPIDCRVTNAWLTWNYHGIPWNAGNMPYDDVQKVVKKVVEHASYIYVKGEEKKKCIEQIINDESKSVIELGGLGCPSLEMLQEMEVAGWHEDYHGDVPGYHCAWKNVQRLKTWYLENCTGSLHKSLHIYLQVGSLKRMKAEDIAHLTKEFILILGKDVIDEVWDKLPESMKNDKDIAGCRKCQIHSSRNDEFDGPHPMVKNCPQCKINQQLV